MLRWWGWGRSHQGTHEHVKVQQNWESRVCVHQLLWSSAAQEPTTVHSHPGVNTYSWYFCLQWHQKQPKTYIIVVIKALLDHVELPVLSGIISYTCAVQPVAVVTADIMINLQGKVSIMKHGCVQERLWINIKNLTLSSIKTDKFLTRRYSNHSAPILQSRPKSFVRKLATFCRPLLDMKPVNASSLMLASTKGTPVFPSEKSRQHIFRYYFINYRCPSKDGNPALPSKSFWRHRSSESTCSPNSTYLSPPISSHLLYPPLLFISLVTSSP